MRKRTTLTAAAGLAAVAIAATIVAAPPEEVAGTPVAAPVETVLPEPTPYVDRGSVIHIPGPTTVVHHPGPGDPECQALEAERTAAREAGVPVIKVPTELMRCVPNALG